MAVVLKPKRGTSTPDTNDIVSVLNRIADNLEHISYYLKNDWALTFVNNNDYETVYTLQKSKSIISCRLDAGTSIKKALEYKSSKCFKPIGQK